MLTVLLQVGSIQMNRTKAIVASIGIHNGQMPHIDMVHLDPMATFMCGQDRQIFQVVDLVNPQVDAIGVGVCPTQDKGIAYGFFQPMSPFRSDWNYRYVAQPISLGIKARLTHLIPQRDTLFNGLMLDIRKLGRDTDAIVILQVVSLVVLQGPTQDIHQETERQLVAQITNGIHRPSLCALDTPLPYWADNGLDDRWCSRSRGRNTANALGLLNQGIHLDDLGRGCFTAIVEVKQLTHYRHLDLKLGQVIPLLIFRFGRFLGLFQGGPTMIGAGRISIRRLAFHLLGFGVALLTVFFAHALIVVMGIEAYGSGLFHGVLYPVNSTSTFRVLKRALICTSRSASTP